MMDARISSMLRPSFSATLTVSWDVWPPMSNSARSVWHEGHTRASASIGESQTGQTFVSLGGVSRHLEIVDAFQSLSIVLRLSGLSLENDKCSRWIISAKRLSEPCPRAMEYRRRGHGLSHIDRRSGQGTPVRDHPSEGHPRHGTARVDEDIVLLHPHVAVPEGHRRIRSVHDARGDRPVASPQHGVARRRALDEHAD